MGYGESRVVRLADYQPPPFLVPSITLDIRLDPQAAKIGATLHVVPASAGAGAPLWLDGEDLILDAILLDGEPVPPSRYEVSPHGLSLLDPPARPFTLTLRTTVNPSSNTKLMGLYRSNGVYCTQCEADGFRRITYFPDRPDVMSRYRVRLEALRRDAPVLLSNGNPVETGTVPGTDNHYAVWEDPFPKPCYLFALVAGHLEAIESRFTTSEGREVALAIHTEPGKAERARYALEALERAMRWDEVAYGRAYDLDRFNIVAVSDFNMGAMENKGLNIFNDKYILASPETATDTDYALIEAIVAHEYFHNWTGNRITCRDWFQLCLKEGLTVFRDQQFSAAMRSAAVKRISDVRELRARQFPEDAGPLAHPVRPLVYREINNFYTATVYEKGAEIIRMLALLLGDSVFRAGMDLYFTRHDGEATTVEHFIACFVDASGRDLDGFFRWYVQAGTPVVTVTREPDPSGRGLTLRLSQRIPAPAGQAETPALPLVIPLRIGLLDHEGRPVPLDGAEERLVILDGPEAAITLPDAPAEAIPSVLRGFSAPVRLVTDLTQDELLVLARHDPDPFQRWEAFQTVATRTLLAAAAAIRRGAAPPGHEALITAAEGLLERGAEDPALAALTLALPSENDLAREQGVDVDPDALFVARRQLKRGIAERLGDRARRLHASLATPGVPYCPDAAGTGRRALRNACLDLIAAAPGPDGEAIASDQFAAADNMTDRLAALAALCAMQAPSAEAALLAFADRYRHDPLVMDKWLALQATLPAAETLERVRALLRHPVFTLANPNRVRALVGSFATGNPSQFHRADGEGYALVGSLIIDIDQRNPQLAARLLTAFRSYPSLEPARRARARDMLQRIAARPLLSSDSRDLLDRMLA